MNCKIRGLSINYEIIGEGKPVIMIPGYYLDHRVMVGCMEPIFKNKEGYKRIYLDLPGMGKSESAQWITNSDMMLEIVVDFIKEIIPDQKFLVGGNSYGGYITRGVVYKMPDKVDGMLLICPVIIPEHKKRNVPEHIVLVKDEALLSRLTPEEAEDFDASSVVQNEVTYQRYENEIMTGVRLANSEFLQYIQKNGYGFSFDVDHLEEKMSKPALILLGKQDDCVGYKDAWSIIDNFPRATVAILDMAGHNLQIEQEVLFNSLVNEWLVRVSE